MTPTKPKLDNVEKVQAAWGSPPDWVTVLAEACNLESQSAVARRLDYSPAAVNYVLSNSYQKGDMGRFEQVVRGVLMAQTVPCPRSGDIAMNVCLEWQKKPFDPTSSHRVRMYQACRSGCPHSRISANDGAEQTRSEP